MSDTPLGREVNIQVNKRKLAEAVERGAVTWEEIYEAPIIDETGKEPTTMAGTKDGVWTVCEHKFLMNICIDCGAARHNPPHQH